MKKDKKIHKRRKLNDGGKLENADPNTDFLSLQVNELLKDVGSASAKSFVTGVSELVRKLEALFQKIPEADQVDPRGDLLRTCPGLTIQSASVQFTFYPPERVVPLGSYPYLAPSNAPCVDLAVVMPSKSFNKDDVKLLSYVDKRSLYLAVLGKYLLKSKIVTPLPGRPLISVVAFRGDRLKPILEFASDCLPASGDASTPKRASPPLRVRLIPVLPDLSIFRYPFPYPPASLLESNNNANAAQSLSISQSNALEQKELRNAIAEDAYMIEHSQLVRLFLDESARENANYLKGLILLKFWLQRNQFESAHHFNGFLMAMLLIHLDNNGVINAEMRPIDVFIATLRWLAAWDSSTGVYMSSDESVESMNVEDSAKPQTLTEKKKNKKYKQYKDYFKLFPVAFIDPSKKVNLTARMTRLSFLELNYHVKLALDIFLASPKHDPFLRLFGPPVDFALRYDCVMTIQCDRGVSVASHPWEHAMYKLTGSGQLKTENDSSIEEIKEELEEIEDEKKSELTLESPLDALSVVELLEKGYNSRVKQLVVFDQAQPSSSLTVPAPTGSRCLVLGLMFEDAEYKRLVEHGPAGQGEEAQAREFTDFWGPDRVEMRKFRGGVIKSCVVWNPAVDAIEGRHALISLIGDHLLRRHFPTLYQSTDSPLFCHFSALDSLAVPVLHEYLSQTEDSKQSVCGNILTKWNALLLILKKLELPLAILSITQTCSVFKYTAPIPPQPRPEFYAVPPDFKFARQSVHVRAMEANIQFEPSSSWPKGLQAIQVIKAAFYLEIMKALKKQFKVQSHASQAHLDVFYEGFVFRFYIFNPREVIMAAPQDDELSEAQIETLLGSLQKKYVQQQLDAADSDERESKADESGAPYQHHPLMCTSPLYLQYLLRPKFAYLIHGLHLRHSSYGLAVRLARLWLSAHMFDSYLSEECVELLVAAAYTQADRVVCRPTNHLTGFLRFIYLLSTWSWQIDPLVVDIGGELTPEAYRLARDSFEMRDQTLPLFIAYDHDLTHSFWTKGSITQQVFDRIVAYATQTYDAIRDHLLPLRSSLDVGAAPECDFNAFQFAKKNWESILFTTAYDDYDVLIHLDPAVCPQYTEKTKGGKPSGQLIFKQHEFYQSLQLNEISQKSGNAGCMGHLIAFDPYETLFQTLKERLAPLGTVYHSQYGKTIGLIWHARSFVLRANPNLSQSRGNNSAGLGALVDQNELLHRMPILNEQGRIAGLVPNIMAVLSEIRSIGKNMITSVVLR